MAWSTKDVPALESKRFVVTGANSGLGFEAATVFARRGAEVLLACRSVERGEEAARRIRAEAPGARLAVWPLDLASLGSVRDFAARFRDSYPSLSVLVNNAGVMAIPRAETADGFEMQLGVNHFGHFALTGLLLGPLLAEAGSRVVTVSSNMSRRGVLRWDDLDSRAHYDKWAAYSTSKLANLLFAFELARRLELSRVTLASLACHPGYADTNLQLVGPTLTRSLFGKLVMTAGNTLLAQSAQAGAWPTVFAATSNTAKNGDFIGPAGIAELRGRPTHVRARKLAHNPEAMQRLWDVSVARTGVDFAPLAQTSALRAQESV